METVGCAPKPGATSGCRGKAQGRVRMHTGACPSCWFDVLEEEEVCKGVRLARERGKGSSAELVRWKHGAAERNWCVGKLAQPMEQ